MAIDFDKIDRSVDLKGLQADVEEAKKNGGGDFPTIPAGKYEARVETLEIKGTKADPNRPMLAVSFKILSGEYKNQRIFMNRVLYGTKNDKNMIASAMGFLDKLDSGVPVSFTSYKQFAQLVLDIAEAIDGKLEYAIDYDDTRFNSVSIDEVLTLRIEKPPVIFIIKSSTICTRMAVLNLNFQKCRGFAPVGPKVKPSRGGAVSTNSPRISESG